MIIRSAGVLTAAEVLSKMFSIALTFVVARRLGAESMGVWVVLTTTGATLNIILVFGLNRYVMREVGKDPDKAVPLMSDIFYFKNVIAGILLLMVALAAIFLAGTKLKQVGVFIVFGSTLFHTHTLSAYSMFRARMNSIPEAVGLSSFRAITTVFSIIMLLRGYGVVALLWIEFIARGITFCFSWLLFYHRFGLPLSIPAAGAFRRLFRGSWRLALIQLLMSVHPVINVFMLSALAGDVQVGYYSAANRLSAFLMLVAGALNAVVFPVLARTKNADPKRFPLMFGMFYRCHILICLPFSAVFAFFSRIIVTTIYGDGFVAGSAVLVIASGIVVINFAGWAVVSAALAGNRDAASLGIGTATLLLNTVLNFVLIPRYGAAGAAFASFCAYTGSFLLHAFALGPEVRRETRPVRIAFMILLGGFGAFLSLHYGSRIGMLAYQRAIAAFCLLFVALVGSRVVSVKDFRYLYEILSKQKRGIHNGSSGVGPEQYLGAESSP